MNDELIYLAAGWLAGIFSAFTMGGIAIMVAGKPRPNQGHQPAPDFRAMPNPPGQAGVLRSSADNQAISQMNTRMGG